MVRNVSLPQQRIRASVEPSQRHMNWIDEADGVFRGGGVKGLALAGALEGFAAHPTKPFVAG